MSQHESLFFVVVLFLCGHFTKILLLFKVTNKAQTVLNYSELNTLDYMSMRAKFEVAHWPMSINLHPSIINTK